MGYLYQLDVTTDFAAIETLKQWLELARYQELGDTFTTEEIVWRED